MARILIDLTGQCFGALRVIRRAYIQEESGARWWCLCGCGNPELVLCRSQALRNDKKLNCGCGLISGPPPDPMPGWHYRHDGKLVRDRPISDRARNAAYVAWRGMLERCENPNHPAFRKYGARGVKVHPRWKNFENFLEDMGLPPEGMTSLNRTPNKQGNYEPGNVQWSSQRRQQRDRTNNRMITAHGLTLCIADWADLLGFGYSHLNGLINRYGLTLEEVIRKKGLEIPSSTTDLPR